MTLLPTDHYHVLGINSNASAAEIKSAYRALVKKHHPDTGGDEEFILALNAAWEVLSDPEQRLAYDKNQSQGSLFINEAQKRGARNARASAAAKATQVQVAAEENALERWLKEVYIPADRLIGQVLNPFPSQIKNLSADPYDDLLMGTFCRYIEQSQRKIKKVDQLFRSIATPNSAKGFGLSLYQCFSQVEDALNELERFTIGYVDNYLHDGREMLREAKQKRIRLHEERSRLKGP